MKITLLSMKILSIRVTLSWKCWGPSEVQGWVARALKPVDLFMQHMEQGNPSGESCLLVSKCFFCFLLVSFFIRLASRA